MKKILVVDDSALMRKVICDIIAVNKDYHVEDIARDGQQAYELLKEKKYDAVILDINMPRMTGLQLLEVLKREHINARVIIASTLAVDGAKETMQALELGAVDFVTKPENFIEARGEGFRDSLLKAIEAVVSIPGIRTPEKRTHVVKESIQPVLRGKKSSSAKNKIVALACSTGGPKSLQSVLPKLPENLDAPVLLVQHMPAGFTATLANRLNELSKVRVKEAQHGDVVEKGIVYIAPGGRHLTCAKSGSLHKICINDDPPRDALRPCANNMYDSLVDCGYDEVVCVVLTGMGADGTEGIRNLSSKKNTYVISQDAGTCVVYGMPKSITEAGLVNEIASLETVAETITKYVGVY